MIEEAYQEGQSGGGPVWCCDQAGPFQAIPQSGASWESQGHPATQPHEYIRGGTAKLLTLFHPATGEVRVEGATSCTNVELHEWLQRSLTEVLAALPDRPPTAAASRDAWDRWQQGRSVRVTLPAELPPLRLLWVLDNLAGPKTPAFVVWLLMQGVMPVYTPLGGSWLTMAESIQRILKRRAVEGTQPQNPADIIAALEATAEYWNADPTPFEWGGKRSARRKKQRERRHQAGGSEAMTRRPVARIRYYGYVQCK